MKSLLQPCLTAILSVCCLPILAGEIRCLQSTGPGKPIRMSLYFLEDAEGHRSQFGHAYYAGQSSNLPLVFQRIEIQNDDSAEGSPYETLNTWLEVLPGEERIGGRYSFRQRGAVMFDFQYHNLRSGKTYHFEDRPEALDDTESCAWPDA